MRSSLVLLGLLLALCAQHALADAEDWAGIISGRGKDHPRCGKKDERPCYQREPKCDAGLAMTNGIGGGQDHRCMPCGYHGDVCCPGMSCHPKSGCTCMDGVFPPKCIASPKPTRPKPLKKFKQYKVEVEGEDGPDAGAAAVAGTNLPRAIAMGGGDVIALPENTDGGAAKVAGGKKGKKKVIKTIDVQIDESYGWVGKPCRPTDGETFKLDDLKCDEPFSCGEDGYCKMERPE